MLQKDVRQSLKIAPHEENIKVNTEKRGQQMMKKMRYNFFLLFVISVLKNENLFDKGGHSSATPCTTAVCKKNCDLKERILNLLS